MIDWIILLTALIAVESGGDLKAVGDNGKAYGQLQIWECVIKDVNRVYGFEYEHKDMLKDAESRHVAVHYLRHYGRAYTRKTGKQPTYETYARIWNGGPSGWKKSATDGYWKKVRKRL